MSKKYLSVFLTFIFLLSGVTGFAYESENNDINIIANAANGEVKISWVNPCEGIISVDVIDEDDNSVLSGAVSESANGSSLSTEAGAWNYVKKTGLINGTQYNYRIVIETADGEEEYPISFIPKGIGTVPITTSDGVALEGTGSVRDNSSQNTVLNYGGMYIDKTEKYSGNSSLKVTQNKSGVFTIIRLLGKNGAADKKYRLTFKAKIKRTTDAPGYFRVTNEEGWSPVTLLYQDEAKSTDWQEYTLDMTNTNKQKKPVIQLDGAVDAVWIDDLTVYELDNDLPVGENLAAYGEFEFEPDVISQDPPSDPEDPPTEPDDPVIPDIPESEQSDINIIANVSTKELRLSWKNPDAVINSIDILDLNKKSIIYENETVNSDVSLLSGMGGTLSYAAGAWNYVKKTGLTTGTNYIYTIEINTENGSFRYPFSFTPSSVSNPPIITTDGYVLSGAGTVRDNNNSNTILDYCGLYIDATEKYSGNSSLKITQNKEGAFTIIRLLSRNGDLEKKYRLKCKAKIKRTINTEGYIRFTNEEGWSPATNLYQNEAKISDWKEYTLDMTNTNKQKKPVLQIEGAVDAVWIDDLSIYELDDDNQPIGENLLTYGDFEFTVGNLDYNDEVLSWAEPDCNGYEGTNVYKVLPDGTRIKLNEDLIPAGTNSFPVPKDSEFEGSYEMVVSTVISGKESSGVKYTVTGAIDYYGTVLSIGGKVTDVLTSGSVTVTQSICNNYKGDEFKVTLILVLYKNNALCEMVSAEKTVPQNSQKTTISKTINIPGDGYELRVFLWDDAENMEILKDCDIYKN